MMKLNFEQDLVDHIDNYLKKNNYKKPIGIDAKSLVHLFLNLRRRLVQKHKRTIIKSKEFKCPIELEKNLKHFEAVVKNGKEIKPYLSKLTSKLSEIDKFLNDWGIHHFHLGMEIRKDGYSKRTGPLLFAKVMPNAIYFIQIFPHGSWCKPDLIEIIHKNWPALISKYKYTLDTQNYSEQEKKTLRNGNINTIVMTSDNTTYFPPGGGLAANGINIEDVKFANALFKRIESLEMFFKQNKLDICKKLKRNVTDDFQVKIKFDANFNIIPYDVSKNITINLK